MTDPTHVKLHHFEGLIHMSPHAKKINFITPIVFEILKFKDPKI